MIAGSAVVAIHRLDCFTTQKILWQTGKNHTYKLLTITNEIINNENFTINYTKGNLLAEFHTE
jgi:hypothetical protein